MWHFLCLRRIFFDRERIEQVLKVWKLLGMLFRIVYPRGHHIHDLSCHDIHDLSWYSQLLLSWYQWCLCHDIHDLSCVVSGHGIHDIHDVRSHDIHDVRSHDRTDLEYWKVWRSLGKCWKVLQSLEKEPSHGHALKLDFESRFKNISGGGCSLSATCICTKKHTQKFYPKTGWQFPEFWLFFEKICDWGGAAAMVI